MAATSSRLVMNLTPPKSLPLPAKWPLPRPPAWTWALRTTGPPSVSNARTASSTVDATIPRGTAAPAAASSSFAWYSWTFIPGVSGGGRAADRYRPRGRALEGGRRGRFRCPGSGGPARAADGRGDATGARAGGRSADGDTRCDNEGTED